MHRHLLHGPGRGLRHGTHDRMGREPAAQRLCRHSPAARNRLIHAYRSQRFVVPRKIRGGRTDDRPGRIHRRGNQRSRTVGRTVLLPPLRQIPGLRFDPERPDALGSPVCRVDTLAILLRRRSQSRHTDRTGRIDRSLRRLDRPLAHRGRERQAGRAGVHRRRAPLLRQRSRRADELARLSRGR